MDKEREATEAAILAAKNAWGMAPAHIRAMAGAYVVPLLAAMDAISMELEADLMMRKVLAHEFLRLTASSGKDVRVFADMFGESVGVHRG